MTTGRLPLPARFGAFVLVGGFCLAANTLALWLLTSVLGLHYLLSTLLAFALITPLGFLLNKVLTFRTPQAHAARWNCHAISPPWPPASERISRSCTCSSRCWACGTWRRACWSPSTLVVINFLTSDRWSFRVQR